MFVVSFCPFIADNGCLIVLHRLVQSWTFQSTLWFLIGVTVEFLNCILVRSFEIALICTSVFNENRGHLKDKWF